MQIAMIGPRPDGGNIVRRLLEHGHDCVVYDATRRRSASWSPPRRPAAAARIDRGRRIWRRKRARRLGHGLPGAGAIDERR